MNETFYLEAEPWKDSPFKIFLVVITCKGKEEAIQVMRDYFKNDSLQPDVKQVLIMKGTLIEDQDADAGALKS